MKALVRTGHGEDDIELKEMPEPEAGEGQVKIRVEAVGVCGTDLHGHPSAEPPIILGHELAGEIIEVGPDVTDRRVGERVTSETTYRFCGKCRFCEIESYSLCIDRLGISTKAPGAFAPYIVCRAGSVHVLPDNISYEAGSLCEPLACAVHAVIEQARVAPGEIVLIVGPGALGIFCVQVAKACGATVVLAGIAADASRLEFAAKLGADRTVDVQQEDILRISKEMTDGYGFDTVFECSGAVPAVHTALSTVRKTGKYVQAGILHRNIELDFDDVFFVREITMLGSHTQKPSSWRKSLELVTDGKVDLQVMVSKVLPLAEWRAAFDLFRRKQVMKIILKPEGQTRGVKTDIQ